MNLSSQEISFYGKKVIKIYFPSSQIEDLKMSLKSIFDLTLNLDPLKFQIRNSNFIY